MKKYLKRVKAILMTAAIILGTLLPAMPVMAATTPTTTIKISGLEDAEAAYAYAIAIDAVDDSGNHYWKTTAMSKTIIKSWTDSGKLSVADGITLYTNLNSGAGGDAHDGNGAAVVDAIVHTGTDLGGGVYQFTDVKAGLYVITAKQAEDSTATYAYNIYAVNYQYDENGTAYLPATVSYALKKTSEPTINKTVEEAGVSAKHGDASIGDEVDFKIEITVPAYEEAWNVDGTRFVITDILTNGLELQEDSIKIEGTSLSSYSKDCTETTFTTNTTGFTLELRGADIYKYRGATISVTYKATVTSDAKVNFVDDINKATIAWSQAPGSDDLTATKESKTHHYTFGIDTLVNGTGSRETTEVTKYGVKTSTMDDNRVLLDGAEFQVLDSSKNVLYFDDNGKLDPTGTGKDHITSKSGGKLTATGLDAGTYYLKESKAPAGYALDKTEYKVVINPTYDELTGELKNYTVQIGDGTSTTLTFKYEKNDAGNIIFNNDGTFAINNTPMAQLPETGSVGVIIVTLVAVVMMVVCGVVFLVLGKKKR